jgi:uncharacterized protein
MNLFYRFSILTSIVFLLGLMAWIKESHAASFNCAKKRSILEIIICADPNLSALDSEVSEKYFTLKSLSSGTQNPKILTEQRKFLQDRLKVCPIPFKPTLSDEESGQIIVCLKGYYTLRIATLKKEIANQEGQVRENIPKTTSTVVSTNQAVGNMPEAESKAIPTNQSIPPKSETTLPQCDQSIIAKKYYVASCITHGMEIGKKSDMLQDAESKMNSERKQIDCSPDSLDRVHAAANSAAERIISSGMISSLMDFGDAITIECNKAATTSLK